MASHLSPMLLQLKASALRSLAVAVGVNSTGAKAQIATRIAKSCCEDVGFFDRSLRCCEKKRSHEEEEVKTRKLETGQRAKRVLSIDMGIRNLALCVIEVPIGGKSLVGEALPNVIAWETISISEQPVQEPILPEESDTSLIVTAKKRSRKSKKIDLDGSVIPTKPRKPKKNTESFEPSKFAVIANTFVRKTLSSFSPDAIIIEQQRYRSHGASAIQQWTVRVNMFEAMLHALFYSVGYVRNGKDAQRKSPVAESVSPSRVSGFWIDKAGKTFEMKSDESRNYLEGVVEGVVVEDKGTGEMDEMEMKIIKGLGEIGQGVDTDITRKKAFGNIKQAKISLVSEWIKNRDVVSFNQEVADTVDEFIPREMVNGKKAKKTPGKKLDDLADCLLQGVAWLRWEENRRSLAEGRLIPELLPCKCISCQDKHL
ncbi:mitochondrial resolvase Ydc2 [Morchella snyderi]|nr:mitochondrial resolvase Ydc2 [Morchella snyderi]